MNENNLGKIISNFRTQRGMTQKELADKLNVSDKAVSRWECGISYPNMDMLLSLSKLFKIPLSELIIARVSTDEKEKDIVQDIVNEYSNMNHKYARRIKLFFITFISIILLFTITIIFTNSYNRFKVYRVFVEGEKISLSNGYYIETKIKDTLSLNNLFIKGLDIKNSDTVSVDLYFLENKKENILQTYSSLEYIEFVNHQSYIEIDDLSNYMDKLYLRISKFDENGKINEYVCKLNFALDFSNNKIYHKEEKSKINTRSSEINVNKIVKILLDNDFEENTGNVLTRKNKNYFITYFIDSNKLNIRYEKGEFSYRYAYSLNDNILSVVVFDENNMEIQNYIYDAIKDKVIECKTGSCNDYKSVMGVLNKNVLNLLK